MLKLSDLAEKPDFSPPVDDECGAWTRAAEERWGSRAVTTIA